MIRCPNCGCEANSVTNTRKTTQYEGVRRRRECIECNARFTTYELREDDFHRILTRMNRKQLLSLVLEALNNFGAAREAKG